MSRQLIAVEHMDNGERPFYRETWREGTHETEDYTFGNVPLIVTHPTTVELTEDRYYHSAEEGAQLARHYRTLLGHDQDDHS